MAKDKHDKQTQELAVARRVGRPPIGKSAMSPSEKMAKQRAKTKELIVSGDSSKWDVRICCEVMKNGKYEQFHKRAWVRYGVLSGYVKA